MWAQRFGGSPDHDVLGFDGLTAQDLADKINQQVAKFHVRIVSMTAYADTWGHHALVTFEREPV